MQIKKSQPEDKWRMPELRFAKFPALSIDPKVGILGDQCFIIFLTYDIENNYLSFIISFIFDIICCIRTISKHHFVVCRITTFHKCHSLFLVVTSCMKVRVLMPFLMSSVSCLSPWARQNFPTPLKIE